MGLLGLGGPLFSEAILRSFGTQPGGFPAVLLHLVGALYLGFALLNWMARNQLIGGIYSRPVALGNLTHFLVANVVLVKHLVTTPHTFVYGVLTGGYVLFAGAFGVVAFAGGQRCG